MPGLGPHEPQTLTDVFGYRAGRFPRCYGARAHQPQGRGRNAKGDCVEGKSPSGSPDGHDHSADRRAGETLADRAHEVIEGVCLNQFVLRDYLRDDRSEGRAKQRVPDPVQSRECYQVPQLDEISQR